MAGLKTLAKELQSKGRNGDTVLAHINPQEAGILKALGGAGTINPDTGLPEYFLKKITQPFVQGVKAIQNIPGIKQVSDVSTQAFKPIDQALVGLDKTVGKAIPGGWETVGQVALSAMGVPTGLQVAYGAARGGGMLRPGSSLKKVNLQGAIIGGATAYATAELGDYMRGAAPGSETASKSLTDAVQEAAKEPIGYTLDASGNLVPQFAENASVVSNTYGPMGEIVPVGSTPPPVPTPTVNYQPPPFDPNYNEFAGLRQPITSSLGRGEFGEALSTLGKDISGAAGSAFNKGIASVQNLGTNIQDFGKAAIDPDTYTGALDKGVDNLSQTGSGIKNLLTGPAGTSKAAAIASGVNPINMTGMALYGTTSLVALDEQRKFLEESKRANAISQAEYDEALASINSQRDYAQSVVNQNPLTIPDIDVSGLGKTLYQSSSEPLYKSSSKTLYAMGGQVDDELGGDYSAMGMDQGNMQKGLFGMGYAAGGQIDMGNGYNPFANLPPMGGSLGAIGAQQTAQTQPSFAQSPYESGHPYDDYASADTFGLSGNSLMSMFNPSAQQNTPQMSPNADQNPNTSMGGFASPSSFYGGGGGSGLASYGGGNSNAFPLEGQYGIVKMAAGGMPRFLSGGGDGMSDSIKATINDNQPARLADGEFVIPADVVSHLGNGSSKAGAKQLYSMMDKIRKARTGRKSQGKQINPRKYLPA